MNRKGFTLIELLAVIVILAIIAVIAVPIVLNIIDESKDNAGLRSADFYLDAVEYTISDAYLNHGGLTDGEYPITPEGNLCKTALPCGEENTLKVEVNGEAPTSGKITITNGNISSVELNYKDGKTIVKNSDGDLVYQDESNLEKVCTIERQNASKYSIGDIVTCELSESIDKFYVIEDAEKTASTIQMLTEKNIHITEYRQSDSAGISEFYGTNAWQSSVYPYDIYDKGDNTLKPIVEGYINYLNENLTKSVTGGLLTYSQALNLGCSYDENIWSTTCTLAPSWLYSTRYWLGTAADPYNWYHIYSTGLLYAGDAYDEFISDPWALGVRPVITISTSEIN